MTAFKKLVLITSIVCAFIAAQAQQAAVVDSIKRELAKAPTAREKIYWLDNLSRTLMNVNQAEAEKYGNEQITIAEESRDRDLMVAAYMSNGLRCSYLVSQKTYANRSLDYYNTALTIARQNKLEEKIGAAQLQLSIVNLSILEKDKALSYVNQAFSLISTLQNDSLLVEAHNTYGRVYLARNEKTLSLRHFFNALRIAEEIKDEKKNERKKSILLRNCYLLLSSFYSNIDEYDKAIDYATLAYKQLEHTKERNAAYQRAIDINTIGNLFAAKKNYDIAIDHFERSIKIADSLKFANLKIPAYISILTQYLRIDEPQKALDYMNSSSGQQLKAFLTNFGLTNIIDQVYGVTYSELNQFDSARLYLIKALPFFEKSTSETNKASFYGQLAGFYDKTRENSKAIEYYLKVKEIGENKGILENVKDAAKHLDTLYARTGDFKMASTFNALYYEYKDSIEKINKQNELAQIEALDEQQRLDRILFEKEEAKAKRNRVQYMAIIIAIAALFIGLVMLGWFKVSASTIKAIGFFAFLLFFEFIFLIFKKNIYGITHGEPLKDLAFMIALAALLVPLHHWLEHKVIHFLTSHHMLKLRGIFTKKQDELS